MLRSATVERKTWSNGVMAAGVVVAILALTSGVLGCGGGSGGGGGGVSLDQFPAAYAQAMCAENFKCCSAADLEGHTMSDCVMNNESTLSFLQLGISAGVSSGQVTYDAAQMAACIDAIKQTSCTDWAKGLSMSMQPSPACTAAITSKGALGSACTDDIDCASGHCDGLDSSATPPVTTGTCKSLVAAGGSCAAGQTCADGLYCSSDTEICTQKKAGGATCTSDDECLNSCNTTTGVCSCYAGCAVAPGTPRPTAIALPLLAAAIGVSIRRRRGRTRAR